MAPATAAAMASLGTTPSWQAAQTPKAVALQFAFHLKLNVARGRSLQSQNWMPLNVIKEAAADSLPWRSIHPLGNRTQSKPNPFSVAWHPRRPSVRCVRAMRGEGRGGGRAGLATRGGGGGSVRGSSSSSKRRKSSGDVWRSTAAGPRVPPVLSPGAGALVRFVRRQTSVDDVWAGLDAASQEKGGPEDIASALGELRRQRDWSAVVQVYEWLVVRSSLFKPDVSTYNLIMDAYGKALQPHRTKALFDAMQEGSQVVREVMEKWSREKRQAEEYEDTSGMGGEGDEAEAAATAGGGVAAEEDSAPVAAGVTPAGMGGTRRLGEGACVPSEASWNVLISAFNRAEMLDDARAAYDNMVQRHYRPSLVTFNTMLDVYGKAGDVRAAEAMFRGMERDGVLPTTTTYTLMIAAYGRAFLPDKANSLFRSMHSAFLLPDRHTFTALIAAFSQSGMAAEAEVALAGMRRLGHRPDESTYQALAPAYLRDPDAALHMHREMVDAGLEPTYPTVLVVMQALATEARWQDAERLLAEVQPRPATPQWQALQQLLLSAYSRAGNPERVATHIQRLTSRNCPLPSSVANSAILAAQGRSGQLAEMLAQLEQMKVEGKGSLHGDLNPVNAAIEVLSELGYLDKAEELFQGVPALSGVGPNVDTWLALMSGFAKRQNLRKCASLFRKMCRDSLKAGSDGPRDRRGAWLSRLPRWLLQVKGVEVCSMLLSACRSKEQEQEVRTMLSAQLLLGGER